MRNTVKGFRLNDILLGDLKTESKEKKITLNNHVNNILERHNETYKNLHKLNYMWVSPEFVKNCIDGQSETNTKKISEIYLDDLKNQVRYCHGDITSHSVMETLENTCLIHNIPVNKKEFTDGSVKYTIIHKLGKNWSKIQKHTIENLIGKTEGKVTEMKTNCDFMSFKINH